MARTAIMKVWNVELGLAVHIKTPNNKFIVIDLGSRANLSPISKLYCKNVGYMVITHPHHDHFSDIRRIGNASPLVLNRCKSYSREELMDGVQANQKEDFITYCDFVESYNGPVGPGNDPTNENTFDGLTAKVYSCSDLNKNNKNHFSAIVVLQLGNARIVVCGDNTPESLQELMKNDSFKDDVRSAWVLVAPHHGRESGYYNEFVSHVNPYLTVISDTNVGSTSVTEKYDQHTRGWKVYNNSTRKTEDRKCVSTRNDGNIKIEFGESDSNPAGVLSVSIFDNDSAL